MGFLIVFGLILIIMVLAIRKSLKWEVDENSCNVAEEEKEVKNNKLMYNIMLYGGIAMCIIGLIGIIV